MVILFLFPVLSSAFCLSLPTGRRASPPSLHGMTRRLCSCSSTSRHFFCSLFSRHVFFTRSWTRYADEKTTVEMHNDRRRMTSCIRNGDLPTFFTRFYWSQSMSRQESRGSKILDWWYNYVIFKELISLLNLLPSIRDYHVDVIKFPYHNIQMTTSGESHNAVESARLSHKSVRKEVGGSCTLTRSRLVHSPNWSAAACLFYLRGWEGGTRTEGLADKRIHARVEARIYGRSQVPGTGSWLWFVGNIRPRITITCFRRGASSSPARSLSSFSHIFLVLSIPAFRRKWNRSHSEKPTKLRFSI